MDWQDFTVVLYAVALAVLGNALLWAIASAFVRMLECSSKPRSRAHEPHVNASEASAPRGKRLATLVR